MPLTGYQNRRDDYEAALAGRAADKYVLRLYITGATRASTRAVANLKAICDRYLSGRYELEVIDIYQQPGLARQEQVIAAPTLVKQEPLPLRRMVGDLSNQARVLAGLGLAGPGVAA